MFKSILLGLFVAFSTSVFSQHDQAHVFSFKYDDNTNRSPGSAVGDSLVSTAVDTVVLGLERFNAFPKTVTIIVNSIDISDSENVLVIGQRGTSFAGGVYVANASDTLTVTAGATGNLTFDIGTSSGSAKGAEALRFLIKQAGSPAATDSAGYTITAIGTYSVANPVDN